MGALAWECAIEHGTVNENPLAVSDDKPFWACIKNLSRVVDQHVLVPFQFPYQCISCLCKNVTRINLRGW